MKAITPSEAGTLKQSAIPDKVVAIVNALIVKHFSNGRSVVKQDDIVTLIRATPDLDDRRIFDDNWLDFESVYRKAGWRVVYDKPGYNESYAATFEFSVPR